jgi:8-oxo-dGTP diphosphatase
MFTEQVKFFQKAIIYHPANPNLLLTLQRSRSDTRFAGQWDLPGGNVDFGENHRQAITREIMEETSLQVGPVQVLEVITHFEAEQQVYMLFVGHTCQAINTDIRLSAEHIAYQWVTAETFLTLEVAQLQKTMVSHLLARDTRYALATAEV